MLTEGKTKKGYTMYTVAIKNKEGQIERAIVNTRDTIATMDITHGEMLPPNLIEVPSVATAEKIKTNCESIGLNAVVCLVRGETLEEV